jgi:hypothetical protein
MMDYALCFFALMLVFWLVCQISGGNKIFRGTVRQVYYCTFMAACLSIAVYPALEMTGLFFQVNSGLAISGTGLQDSLEDRYRTVGPG